MRFVRSLGCGFVVLLALWPLASLKLHAVELGPIAQPLLSAAARQRLTALATRYVAEGRVPGLHLMVRRGGQLVFEAVVGQRALADNRPLLKNDLYRMYSMTKPVTAVAIMQLYEQGHFRLSDPVTRWLPELEGLRVRNLDGSLSRVDTPITMRHVLTHTAGFSYGFDLSDPLDAAYRAANLWGAADLDDWVRRVATLPLKFQPGAQWHYSIASDLTGLLVQRMSGQSLAVYLQQAIFEPLKMTDTFFEVPTPQRARLLENHVWNKTTDAVERVRGTVPSLGLNAETDAMSNFDQVSLFSGGAGLVSTAQDYMRFADMLRLGGALEGARILQTETLKLMTRNHLPEIIQSGGRANDALVWANNSFGYGLGFSVVIDDASWQPESNIGSYFWGGAAGTIFWVDPEADLVALALIQLMDSPWPLRKDLSRAIYGPTPKTRPSDSAYGPTPKTRSSDSAAAELTSIKGE